MHSATDKETIGGPTDALLLIDLQPDFMPGGALAILGGDEILPLINTLAKRFDHVLLTQDWHPLHHISFASTHPGAHPDEQIQAPYGPQTLWPDHCLQGTAGAALHPALDIPQVELILRKGFRKDIDSYSAFLENDHATSTGLAGYLRERGVKRLFLAGLAYDFCVRFSALDGKALGFETLVLEDACRPVNLHNSVAQTNDAFAAAGITPRVLYCSRMNKAEENCRCSIACQVGESPKAGPNRIVAARELTVGPSSKPLSSTAKSSAEMKVRTPTSSLPVTSLQPASVPTLFGANH